MKETVQKILLIDDDLELCGLLQEYLSAEGYVVEAVHDGEAGVQRASEGDYNLVVLDVMLPRLNGFEVLRRIRSISLVPILMLTSRGEEIDRILGLEMGADDYLPKSFNHRELLARIRAIQRRTSPIQPKLEDSSDVFSVGDITLSVGARSVTCRGILLDLTSAEFSLLELFLRQSGKILSREELLLHTHGRELNYNDRSIDVHMSNLRRKLGPTLQGAQRIKAVRGAGYIYTKDDTASR